MYNIKESGFYNLADISADIQQVHVDDNLEVIIYDEQNISYRFSLGEKTKLSYFGLLQGSNNKVDKHFQQNQPSSELNIYSILLSKDKNKLESQIYSQLSADHTSTNMNILSFIGNDGFVALDGVIKIDSDLHNCSGHLAEENIFLGNSGQAKGIPTLFIESDDVEASHSCKMERINDEKMFYLRSRWISADDSLSMMIQSYTKVLYNTLKEKEEDFYDQKIQSILSLI